MITVRCHDAGQGVNLDDEILPRDETIELLRNLKPHRDSYLTLFTDDESLVVSFEERGGRLSHFVDAPEHNTGASRVAFLSLEEIEQAVVFFHAHRTHASALLNKLERSMPEY